MSNIEESATIVVDGVSYTGKSVREARNLARRASAKERKLREAASGAYSRATERAQSQGYNILSRVFNRDVPPGWSVSLTGTAYGPKERVESGESGKISIFDTEAGRGEWGWPSTTIEVLGVLRNGAGYDIAVFVSSTDGVEAFSIGVARYGQDDLSVARLASLPGVTLEYFRTRGSLKCFPIDS